VRDGDPAPVLVVTALHSHPQASLLQRLEHEYALRAELEKAWAARPLELRYATIPKPLVDIVLKWLGKTAETRYQTGAGLEADLRRCRAAWETWIGPFPRGAKDIPDRLLVRLLAAFERIGLDPAAANHIFTPFYTTKSEGYGDGTLNQQNDHRGP
jgi:hypothetical protein